MKHGAVFVLILGLVGSAVIARQTSTEPLTVVGPFYQLQTASGAAYTISGPPGTYQVPGTSMVPGLAPVPVQITIVIPRAGDAPPLPPNPSPVPTPNPPIVTGKLWAIFIADTNSVAFATAGSFQSRLWASTAIKDALAKPPVSTIWRQYDAADPFLATTKWGKMATQMGLPCLLLVDEKGTANLVPLPADEAAIVAAARKARGL